MNNSKKYTLINNKNGGRYNYSNFEWHLAWAIMYVLGFIAGFLFG